MTTTDHMRTITAVKAKPPATLTVQWSDATRVKIDLGETLRKRAFGALRDPAEFVRVRVGEWGHSVEWAIRRRLSAETLWLETLSAIGRDGHAGIFGMAFAPRAVAERDREGARSVPPHGRLLLER